MSRETGLQRNGNDTFFTKKEVAHTCIQLIREVLFSDIKPGDLLIEPSAGDGSFIEPIKSLSQDFKASYKFYDIDPKHEEVEQLDFLTFTISEKILPNKEINIHFIGNPPFGRQSSLAKKFIKKCSDGKEKEKVKSISFILPKSFKKESFQKTFPLGFHLVKEWNLPTNSFTVNGVDHDVPCVFQIWKREDYEREINDKEEPNNFIFVKKTEPHDISVRRLGINAGEVSKETAKKNPSSHYFLKFSSPISSHDFQMLSSISFPRDNTVGPRSISKPELIREFNRILS